MELDLQKKTSAPKARNCTS